MAHGVHICKPQGIRAAVLSGLAITVLTRDDLEPGMTIVDGQYGRGVSALRSGALLFEKITFSQLVRIAAAHTRRY